MVDELKQNGRDFKNHIFVPEIDQTTNEIIYYYEDHGHLVKRVVDTARRGCYAKLDMDLIDAAYKANIGKNHVVQDKKVKQHYITTVNFH